MKLRIKGNTIRFRLTQTEVAQLAAGEPIRDHTEFAPGQCLTWSLDPSPSVAAMESQFRDSAISVLLPATDVRRWADTDLEGLYSRSGTLEIAVEKDFRCLHRTASPEEGDNFPNRGKH